MDIEGQNGRNIYTKICHDAIELRISRNNTSDHFAFLSKARRQNCLTHKHCKMTLHGNMRFGPTYAAVLPYLVRLLFSWRPPHRAGVTEADDRASNARAL